MRVARLRVVNWDKEVAPHGAQCLRSSYPLFDGAVLSMKRLHCLFVNSKLSVYSEGKTGAACQGQGRVDTMQPMPRDATDTV